MRHQTLYDTNLDLFENLIANSDKLKELRTKYEQLIINHNSNKMTINSKLGELMQIKEQIQLKNSRAEEALLKDSDKKRERVSLYLFKKFSIKFKKKELIFFLFFFFY